MAKVNIDNPIINSPLKNRNGILNSTPAVSPKRSLIADVEVNTSCRFQNRKSSQQKQKNLLLKVMSEYAS